MFYFLFFILLWNTSDVIKIFGRRYHIGVNRIEMFVGNAFTRTKFAHHGGYFGIMTVMNAWEEVVLDLIIETPVEPT